MGKNMWRLTTHSLLLIPVAIGVNYIGKTIASALKLPLWLDSIGTIFSAMLGGPIVGALSGAINNIIYGLTLDPISFVYAITSLFIGFAVGVLAYKGWIDNILKALVIGLVVVGLSAIISTPINLGFYGGQTGNFWGDALFTALLANDIPRWLASFLDELVVDLPDKLITIMIGFLLVRSLPKSFVNLYHDKKDIESI